jgi:hypothetical protein
MLQAFVAVPSVIELATVIGPTPPRVRVRGTPVPLMSIPPLKTSAPVVVEEAHVPVPPVLMTFVVNVCVAVELLVIPDKLAIVSALPVANAEKLYAFAPELKIKPKIDLSPTTTESAPAPVVAPKIATLPLEELILDCGTTPSVQAVVSLQFADAPLHVEATIEMETVEVVLKAPAEAIKLTGVLLANAVGVP